MSVDAVRAVADAVLYEGYLLYPYRASAQKNRSRWQFGVVMPDERGKPERQQEKEHRTDHRAGVPPCAADDDHEEEEEGVLDAEDRRVHRVVDERVDHPSDAGERARQREGDHLGARHVDAHRRCGFRVVAHRPAGAAKP